jgi:hypothetical protein
MHKIIYILIVLAIANAFTVFAANSHLDIDRVEVIAGDKTILSTGSSSGTLKVDPGDELEIRVRLKNTYSESTYNDISDVRVAANIDDLGLSDSDTTSVNAGTHRTVTLRLDIPDDAKGSQSYYLEITADGRDENNTIQEDRATYELEVNREYSEININEFTIGDGECDSTANMRIELENNGEQDEDVELEINAGGERLYSEDFTIQSISDDNTYTRNKHVPVSGLDDGTYTATLTVNYNDKEEKQTTEFTVTCDRVLESTYYSSDTEDRTVEEATPAYTNPKRDLSFLYTPEVQPVEVVLPPPMPRLPSLPAPRESAFGTVVLLLANIAILIFIVLLVIPLYEEYKEKINKE